jgi:glucose/arabinose dehydrogenase
MGLVLSLIACFSFSDSDNIDLNNIKLPPGFHISLYAGNVENARSMALGTNGTVFVGTRDGDEVYALLDEKGDATSIKKYVILKGYKTPNGVAFHNKALYVAQVDKIWRLDDIESHLGNPPKPVLVFDKLPHDAHHGWKYIAFGPDNKLYIPVGAPCNVCEDSERDPRYASITRINPDGTGFEIYASGVRNTVGFDWNPSTKELWFTDNGRDMMGDNMPPDELNKAPHKGMNFGFPYCHGDNISDPQYGKKHPCSDFVKPVVNLHAHVASLGMKFYKGNMFPAEYKNQIFIAEHGSWNSSVKVGYRVVVARIKADGTGTEEPFATGFLKDGKPWGRPVDVLELRDGSLLVSDDFAGAIYRITYSKPTN